MVKERHDQKLILSERFYSVFGEIADNRAEDVEIHVIYAGNYYSYHYGNQDKLKSFILRGMKMHRIKSAVVTFVRMQQNDFITKQKMESFCRGKEKEKYSVNDDLESLFQDLRLGKKQEKFCRTYFLPKLKEKEIALFETNNPMILETFYSPVHNPFYYQLYWLGLKNNFEFIEGLCSRSTITVENSL